MILEVGQRFWNWWTSLESFKDDAPSNFSRPVTRLGTALKRDHESNPSVFGFISSLSKSSRLVEAWAFFLLTFTLNCRLWNAELPPRLATLALKISGWTKMKRRRHLPCEQPQISWWLDWLLVNVACSFSCQPGNFSEGMSIKVYYIFILWIILFYIGICIEHELKTEKSENSEHSR